MKKGILLKIVESGDYIYLIYMTETRYWYVKRIDSQTNEFKYADTKFNPQKNIIDALTNPQSLVYNFYYELI